MFLKLNLSPDAAGPRIELVAINRIISVRPGNGAPGSQLQLTEGAMMYCSETPQEIAEMLESKHLVLNKKEA